MATVSLSATLNGGAFCGAFLTASLSFNMSLVGESTTKVAPPTVVVRAVAPVITKDAALVTRFAYSRKVGFLGDFDLNIITVCKHIALGDLARSSYLGVGLGGAECLGLPFAFYSPSNVVNIHDSACYPF